MYLSNLSNEQKELFLDLSIISMQSDGVIAPREQEAVYQYCNEMEIERRTDPKYQTADEVLRKLKDISAASELKMMTIELVALMYADEDFADEENALLMNLQNTFGFSSHLMEEIIFATRHLLLSHKMLARLIQD